jgi:ABC-type transporter Mla subunit MlaD
VRLVIFTFLGLLEITIAAVLIGCGLSLPDQGEVAEGFTNVEKATRRTGDQVDLIRQQVHDLRRPELKELTDRLNEQTRIVARTLRKQKVDYKTLETVSDALGQVSAGLNNLSGTLDPEYLARFGDGLGQTASFLDERVIPTAKKAADDLEESLSSMQADGKQLARLLRSAAPDLKALQEVHDGLARFGDGLARMNGAMKMEHLNAMKEGFEGLEVSLKTGAEQVEDLSSYTYPVVTFNGLKPEIEQRKFWPKGDDIAWGMRKAATGVQGASKEMDRLTAELPKMRETLDESRKVAERARAAMAAALKQRDQIEPLLKQVPEQAAILAEQLPRLGADLVKILRETDKLNMVAASLRDAQKNIDTAVDHLPQTRAMLARSATLLLATQQQLKQALENRREFESAMRQTILLAEMFAILLPEFTDQIDSQLAQHERTLGDLGQSIHEVSATVPVYSRTASRLVHTARLLLLLLGIIFALHGCYLAWTAIRTRRPNETWYPAL